MKITHLLPRFPYFSSESIVGGAANALYNLMKIQSKSLELTLITSVPKNSIQKIDNPIFTIEDLNINLPGFSKRFGISFSKKVFFYPLRNKIVADLIHGHSGFFDYIIPSVYLSVITNKPLVYSLYCPIIANSQISTYFGRTALLSRLAKNVSKFIAISKNIKQSVINFGIKESDIHIVPPAIDISRFHNQIDKSTARRKLGFEANELIILFVGNTHSTKNLETVLDVLALIKTEFPKVKLIVTTELRNSESRERDQFIFDKIASLNLFTNLQFLGIVDSMPSLMAASDLLVAPFLSTEGPSDYFMSVLEAMAVGRPVIVSNVGGMPEIIKNELGYLVDPLNIDQITHYVYKLLIDPIERKKIGDAASDFAKKKFDPVLISQRYTEIYQEVLT